MIYFVQMSESGRIKIGYSGDPAKRLIALQTGIPETLHLLGVMNGDKSREEAIHRQFSDHRIRGEWFEPSAELLDYIHRYAKKPEPVLNSMGAEIVPCPTTHRDQIRYLWEGWIPRKECSMLIGNSGVGKSFLALDIVRRLLNDDVMPDGRRTERSSDNLIWVDVNGHIQEHADKIRQWQSIGILSDTSMDQLFVMEAPGYPRRLDLSDKHYQDYLLEMVAELRPDWIVVDSIMMALPQEKVAILNFLYRLAEAFDTAVTLLDLKSSKPISRQCRFVLELKCPSRKLSHPMRSLGLIESEVASRKSLVVELRTTKASALCLTYSDQV